jgi:hypothetical protein
MRDMLLGHLALANLENANKQFEECIKFQYSSMEIGKHATRVYIFSWQPTHTQTIATCSCWGIFVFQATLVFLCFPHKLNYALVL